MSFCKTIRRCRSCDSVSLDEVLEFGEPYISDFVEEDEVGIRAPLLIVRCTACGLVQMGHDIDPAVMFSGRYWYRSGTNEGMVAALHDVVDHVRREVKLLPGKDHVLDIGANDGTLLTAYSAALHRWAVEPSETFQDVLREKGFVRLGRFWPDCHVDLQFKAITSVACFYASQDPNGFVAKIKRHLAPDGVWVLQLQTEETILQTGAWDYFCHEHTCLWGVHSLLSILYRHGLCMTGCERVPVNGGSMRLTIRHGAAHGWDSPASYSLGAWEDLAKRVTSGMDARLRIPQSVLGVGASTKANTVLQYWDIGPEQIPAIIDRNPEKIGRYTVGSRIPIISEKEGAARDADTYVALAWQFLDGLRARSPDKRFMTLLPEVRKYPALTKVEAIARSSA